MDEWMIDYPWINKMNVYPWMKKVQHEPCSEEEVKGEDDNYNDSGALRRILSDSRPHLNIKYSLNFNLR